MIIVTGSTGFLGKRVCNLLEAKKIEYLAISKSNGPDLCDQKSTISFFDKKKPKKIINCAAFVGGIQFGYKYPAEIFHKNLNMTLNLLEASKKNKIQRIVNPISNCVYPSSSTFFKESDLWNGAMHESVMVYGLTRRASLIGSWAYAKQYNLDVINLIFSNMYGPEDHFHEERSHALGALVMKTVRAKLLKKKEVVIWGSGKPIREWLHVDDAAEAMVRGLDVKSFIDPINIGVGKGISIMEMANLIKDIVGYEGEFIFDKSKSDGAPHKTSDGTIGFKHFGWCPSRSFQQGLKETVDWYINNLSEEKKII
jgi:GDP-L-fucose synthase